MRRRLTVLFACAVTLLAFSASPDTPPAGSKPKKPPRPAARPSPRPSPSPSPSASPRPSPSASPRVFTDEDLPSSATALKKRREQTKEEREAGPAVDPALEEAERLRRAEEERQVNEGYEAQKLAEREWRQRAGASRDALKSAEQAVAALEEQARQLAGEIMMSTDTNQILALQAKQRKVAADLEAARAGVVAARQSFAELEEEARRKGISRSWLEP